ncbi:MAG: DNA-binding response regulator, partial [Sphingomonas sp.]
KLAVNGGDEIIRTVRNRGYLFLPRVEARAA